MRTNEDFTGALIKIDPSDGFITDAYICAQNEQDAAVVHGTLARITDPRKWGWFSRLLSRKKKAYRPPNWGKFKFYR